MEIEEVLSYWRVIKKRLWLIILLFVATMAVVLVTTLTAAPVYSATVKLQVIGSEPQQVSLFSTVRASTVGDEIAGVQSEFTSILKNGLVAWRTIASLNLNMGAVDLLNAIGLVVDGEAIYVTAQADTPQKAEKIVNAHVDNALSYYREYRALPAKVTRQFLTQQVAAAGETLAETKDALLKFKLKNNIESLDRELLAYQDMIRTLETQRDASAVQEQSSRTLASAYRSEAASAKLEMDKVVITATATLALYRDEVGHYQELAVQHEAEAEAHKTAKGEYDQLISQKGAELLALIGLSKESGSLERAVSVAESNYNFLLSKENEAKLKETTALGVGYIQITEPARTPDAPAQSSLPKLAALGAVSSILAGIIFAFILEFLEGLGRAVSSKERAK